MISTETPELAEILGRVTSWPAGLRIQLARRILESIETSETANKADGRDAKTSSSPTKTVEDGPRPPRGYSAAEVIARLQSPQPAPDDDTVKRWIDEHRMGKYAR